MARIAAACACLVALGGAPPRPNLVEARLFVSQDGASLLIRDVVRNTGSGPAPASTTGYYLGGARIGRRALPAIRPHSGRGGSVTLVIPRTAPVGSHHLRACADDRARVTESDEHDNCRTSAQVVRVADRTPPSFAGLERATTCIPGPVGGGTRSTPYSLRWSAAEDDVTPFSAVVYEVYQARVAGGETFAAPTYTTKPGATTFSTPPLPNDKAYYFVVRARDEAGNRERNKIERLGVNLCL